MEFNFCYNFSTAEKKWRSQWLKNLKKLKERCKRCTKMVQSYGGVAFPVCCVFLGPWNETILNVSINGTVFVGHFCLIYH